MVRGSTYPEIEAIFFLMVKVLRSNSMVENPAVGIDLGTTFSCIAVYQNGEPVVIQNKLGNNITPSVVAFKDNETHGGEGARNKPQKNVKNTIYQVKRLIGRSFDDPVIQDDLERFHFETTNLDGKVGIKVEVNGESRIFGCEYISSCILREMKEMAQAYLQCPVKEAVISVPAYFTNAQREATIEAARLADLKVLRLIHEPTAGAMTYGTQLKNSSFLTVLVFDLGGGTFDVSVLKVYGSSDFEVRAVGGDAHLGGEDFDTRLMEFCLQKFTGGLEEEKYCDRAMWELRVECERTKRMLSTSFRQTVEVPSFHRNEDLIVEVHREDFERVNQELFDKTIEIMEDVLEDNNIEKSEIDEVVLIGGSCRIPKIQKMVENFFGKKPLMSSGRNMSLDTAVACGAAIFAAHKLNVFGVTPISVQEVTPRSIGVSTLYDRMHFFLRRNDRIPFEHVHVFTTVRHFQDVVEIEVFEGESDNASDNDLLAHFNLYDITEALAGVIEIEIQFVVDEDGILKVTAAEKGTNEKKEILIEKSCLTGRRPDCREGPYGQKLTDESSSYSGLL